MLHFYSPVTIWLNLSGRDYSHGRGTNAIFYLLSVEQVLLEASTTVTAIKQLWQGTDLENRSPEIC